MKIKTIALCAVILMACQVVHADPYRVAYVSSSNVSSCKQTVRNIHITCSQIPLGSIPDNFTMGDDCIIPEGMVSRYAYMCGNDSLWNANTSSGYCDFESYYPSTSWNKIMVYDDYGTSITLTTLAVDDSTGCYDCSSDKSWKVGNKGYVHKTTRTCYCGACYDESTIYNCAASFYGSTTDGATGCTECPSLSGAGVGNSDIGTNTDITKCYIPAGDDVDVTEGTYSFTDDCNYSK